MEPLFPQLGFLPGERELRMTGRPAAEVLQMLNPIPGIMNAMQQAGRAADPNLSPEERRAAFGESAMETGIAALPIAGGALGRMILRNAPTATRAAVSETGDIVETLTAARPDAPDIWAETAADFDEILARADDGVEEALPAPDAPAVDQNIVNALEQPIAGDNIIDPQDIDFNDAAAFNEQFTASRNRPPLEPEQTGMLSTVGRAALNLEQPRYGSYDEVVANLKRLGARESEFRASGIGSLRDVEGPISQDMVREAIEGDNPLEVIRFSGMSTRHNDLFTPGGEDYREVVVRSPNGLNVFKDVEGLEPGFALQPDPDHLPDAGTNQVVHYRAATFPVEGGETYHVGEIQSDWAQDLRLLREDKRVFNLTPEEAADLYTANQERRIEIRNKHEDILERQRQLDEDHNSGLLRTEDWGAQSNELALELSDLDADDRELIADQNIWKRNWTYAQTVGRGRDSSGPRKRNVEEPFVPEGPIVSSTNDVTQMAVRQALLDAVNSPQNYLTFGTGDMAFRMTGGRLSGQRKYYDEIVPRQLRQTLRRLAREYDIEVPEVEQIRMYSNDRSDSYTVPGIQLTPELRQAIADFGMPMFKEGGMVNLKSGLASMANEVL